MINEIILGDCLVVMKDIPDNSIDMILCDLPYGTTACKWDSVIPFEPLWEQYKRIIKDNGAILLFGAEPFSSALRFSNIKEYKYDWIWRKSRPSNFQMSKKQPMRYTENISVFYRIQPTYNPIKTRGEKNHRTKETRGTNNIIGQTPIGRTWKNTSDMKYPSNIIDVKSTDSTKNFHPTQKPVALFEYLIKTYTNEGEIVLDNCIGSGTTAIACINTGRNFIGIEKDEQYHKIACERVKEYQNAV